MRKPRNYDAELKALDQRAKDLRARKIQQLGELVIATGAESLSIEMLAGVLIAAVETKDAAMMEAWRIRGDAFFRQARRASNGASKDAARNAPDADKSSETGSAESML